MEKKILIAIDEPLMVKGLKFCLEQEGYSVESVYDKKQALKKAGLKQYVLIIIDISSSQINGFSLYQAIREKSNTPVMVITDNADEVDEIISLEGGPYEYITKPISIAEFRSKVNAAVMKSISSNNNSDLGIIKLWDLTIDTENRSIIIGNREIELTSKEYEILVLLAQNKNRVYSREDLLRSIWGFGYSGDKRIVDVHIRRLREKVESDPSNPIYVMTKWGEGYYFNG